jgi:hypothetical protein
MKRFYSLALVFAIWSAGSPNPALARSDVMDQYHNGTFDFTLRVPESHLDDYLSVTTPEGITFTSPDGLAVVNIFGSWNEGGKSLAAIVDQYRSQVPEAEFTYEWQGKDAAVLSGYEAGDIFYVRIAMSPDRGRVAVLNMIYPPELKRQLDAAVTRLSTSLTIR